MFWRHAVGNYEQRSLMREMCFVAQVCLSSFTYISCIHWPLMLECIYIQAVGCLVGCKVTQNNLRASVSANMTCFCAHMFLGLTWNRQMLKVGHFLIHDIVQLAHPIQLYNCSSLLRNECIFCIPHTNHICHEQSYPVNLINLRMKHQSFILITTIIFNFKSCF